MPVGTEFIPQLADPRLKNLLDDASVVTKETMSGHDSGVREPETALVTPHEPRQDGNRQT